MYNFFFFFLSHRALNDPIFVIQRACHSYLLLLPLTILYYTIYQFLRSHAFLSAFNALNEQTERTTVHGQLRKKEENNNNSTENLRNKIF